VVEGCVRRRVGVLTVFAFSSENWRRPEKEVGLLMGLFVTALEQRARELHKNNVRLRVIGERSAFSAKLQERIEEAERLTRLNTGLQLVIAANYGGRWDIVQAALRIARAVRGGILSPEQVDPAVFQAHLSLHGLPEPDLFIRTGGEQRISNFLLWDLAYTELYFTETLWPDFDAEALDQALLAFSSRQRRFGRTGEQVATGEPDRPAPPGGTGPGAG
jgi:undecaprenyl diphosphate synthase